MTDKKNIKDKILNEIIIIILIALFFLIFFRPFIVNGNSMDNSLYDGEYVLIQKHFFTYKRGDIIIAFITKKTTNEEMYVIKRLIALPGDTVEIKDNKVYVNGKIIKEPYIKEKMITEDMESIKLEKDEYFVMGDNRNDSYDSREQGPLKEKELKGRLILKV